MSGARVSGKLLAYSGGVIAVGSLVVLAIAHAVDGGRAIQAKQFVALAHEPMQPLVHCSLVFSGGALLDQVPVARTKEQQARGLSGDADARLGMLFPAEPPGPMVFWMHGTRMPLSVAFYDSRGVVFKIEDMDPETDNFHLSMKPAAGALELAQGRFKSLGIEPGQIVQLHECRP